MRRKVILEIKNTKDVQEVDIKVILYGLSGSGKTRQIKTLDKPLILSAEAGLLSIAGFDADFIKIETLDDLRQSYEFLKTDTKYKTVVLDSVSEIAEVVLTAEKKLAKDPRQAYGALADSMSNLIRAFRDLPGKDVVFIAKAEKEKDQDGKLLYSPSMPGQKLGQALPYFFDEVLALRVEKNEEGKTIRAFQTEASDTWSCKDRSGKLDPWEPADLGAIFKKIRGEK